jgi:hypothetical protein
MEKTTRRPIKNRDKLKYAFATVLALSTAVAIAGLVYGRVRRERITKQDRAQVQEFLSLYGDDGKLPPKIKPPANKPAVD